MPNLKRSDYDVLVQRLEESAERKIERLTKKKDKMVAELAEAVRAAEEMPEELCSLVEKAAVVLTKDFTAPRYVDQYQKERPYPRIIDVDVRLTDNLYIHLHHEAHDRPEDQIAVPPGHYRALFLILPLPTKAEDVG